MIFKGIRKIHEGRFITRYDVDYITAEGHAKTYEMISRNKHIETLSDLQNRKADSVPTLPDKKERTLSETTAWGSFFENNIDLHQKTLRVEAKVRSWPRVKRSLGMEMSKELRIIQRSSDSTLTNL